MKIDLNILSSEIIVIKIGSSLLIKNNLFNRGWLKSFLNDVKLLREKEIKIIIVASGAVALGIKYLKIKNNEGLKINEKQAYASCGQSLLMKNFIEIFEKESIKVSQILLTFSDTEERKRNLNARETINALLNLNVIPIINENDTVARDELKFGDNDRLAAKVAQISNANFLILLSDVDGLYNKNPNRFDEVKLIRVVETINKETLKMGSSETNLYGSGGMKTKIEAAQMAMSFGCDTIICSGKEKNPILRIINEPTKKFTWFKKQKFKKQNSLKKWIAGTLKISGRITIDNGAYTALIKGASLLPSGITFVDGKFNRGDILQVLNKEKVIIAKGISCYTSDEVIKLKGKKTKQIRSILGYEGQDEIIHRDNLIINEKRNK